MSLDSAIKDGVETVDKGLPPPLPKDDKTPVGVTTDKKDEEDDGLSPEEIKNARNFYRGLKDPEKAPTLIKFIAEQAGFSKIETKADVKEAKRDINAILLDKLGDEYAPLIEKLGPALDEILKDKLAESTKDIRDNIENEKKEKIQNEAKNVFMGLSKSHYDGKDIPDDVAKEMNTLMEDFEPSANMSMEKYLTHLHTLAVGNLGLTTNANKDKIAKNRTDAPSRLASERGHNPGEGEKVPQKMTLDQAVKAAVEEVEKRQK